MFGCPPSQADSTSRGARSSRSLRGSAITGCWWAVRWSSSTRSNARRPRHDVDVVVDLRVQPTGLAHVHGVLTRSGFDQSMPSADGIAHRYHRGDATFDVLAPDSLGKRVRLTLGSGRTIEAPGASQALVRSSLIRVELVDGRTAPIRRPTLVGALLGKVAAATQIVSQSAAERAKHTRDVDSLARLLGPADRDRANLTRRERTVLRRIAESSDLSPLAQRSIVLLASWPDGPPPHEPTENVL